MMIKKSIFAFLVLLVLFNSTACEKKNSQPPPNGSQEPRELVLETEKAFVKVFYSIEEGAYLVPVTLAIKPTKEAAKIAVEKLLAGPKSNFLDKTFPEDTKLLDMYAIRDIVYVDLTKDFLKLSSYEAVEQAVRSLVLTLTEFPDSNGVQLLVEGQFLDELHEYPTGEVFSRLDGINLVVPLEEGLRTTPVYYSDSTAQYLVPLSIAIEENSTVQVTAAKIMEALLNGPPEDSSLVRTIWPDTKLLNTFYDEDDRLLTIDVSQEVIGYGGGSAAEIMLVDSIVNSLTAIPGVNAVRILIEGSQVDYLPEGTTLDEPLLSNERINFEETF